MISAHPSFGKSSSSASRCENLHVEGVARGGAKWHVIWLPLSGWAMAPKKRKSGEGAGGPKAKAKKGGDLPLPPPDSIRMPHICGFSMNGGPLD